jgi:hypothetical protein
MVTKIFVVNYHNINPIWVPTHASIHIKKVLVFKSKKGNSQGIL